MNKLLPVILLILGIGAGAGAGFALKSNSVSEEAKHDEPEAKHAPTHQKEHGAYSADETSYVKLANQFVVPVVKEGKVSSMVVLTLGVETTPANKEEILRREPKLRDALLQVLFDHANLGGFDGAFTKGSQLSPLRKALNEQAYDVLGSIVHGILIMEIARQDA